MSITEAPGRGGSRASLGTHPGLTMSDPREQAHWSESRPGAKPGPVRRPVSPHPGANPGANPGVEDWEG